MKSRLCIEAQGRSRGGQRITIPKNRGCLIDLIELKLSGDCYGDIVYFLG